MSYIEAVKIASENLKGSTPEWMHAIQQRGRALWSSRAWPDRKTEDWRYTNLSKLAKSGLFSAAHKQPQTKNINEFVAQASIDIPGAKRIVLLDGVFSQEHSTTELPSGISVTCFSALSDSQASLLSSKLGSIVDTEKHYFMAQSDSLLRDGLFVQVEANAHIAEPLYLLCVNTQEQMNGNFRVFVDSGENSQVSLLEHYVCADEQLESDSLVLNCTELDLAPGAMLNHFRLNMHSESCFHIGGVHCSLGTNSTLNSFYLALGTQLTRIDATVNHLGEGAHTNMNGVYLPRNSQHVDIHTNLAHCVPNTTSSEIFRGVIGDSSRAVFNGRIHIHPKAQKTNAQLSNKNLLTSNKAEVDTKPELEIYANDVLCAHGATVAQLNDASLHYLLTRGVSKEEARVMLSFGFINELIQKIDLPGLQEFLRPLLAKRFASKEDLVQHLI